MKIAVVVSHVIQHFCPQYVSWAALPGVELRVVFGSRHGLDDYFDVQFNKVVQWKGLNLNFPHEFLSATESSPTGTDAAQLDDVLDKFGAEIVLVYGYDQPLIRRTISWAKRRRANIMMLADVEMRSHRHWVKALAKLALLPRVLRQVDIFLTVGDACEDYYRNYSVPDTKMVRSPFPIDRNIFETKIANREAISKGVREKLAIPLHHKIVLNVGKLVPWKRPEDLISLSNRLQGRRDDITVVHVGAGKREAELRAQLKKAGPGGTIFVGFVQPSDLVDYVLASDVYALTSSLDCHSLAVSEAVYAGLPVLVSDRCGSYGPTDDVRPGVNGFVFPCGDVDRMTDLLLQVLNSATLYKRFSLASRAIGLQNQALAHGEGLLHAIALLQSISAGAAKGLKRLDNASA
jgi:glycosyltransferase involved in cell wall biosynthesis